MEEQNLKKAYTLKDVSRELFRPLKGINGQTWFIFAGTMVLMLIWQVMHRADFYSTTMGKGLDASSLLYGRYLWYHLSGFVLLIIVPLTILKFFYKCDLKTLGFQFGDTRFGLRVLAIAFVIITPITLLAGFDPAMQAEYPLVKGLHSSLPSFIFYELTYCVYFLTWEPFLHGILLFGLKDKIGTLGALFYVTAICCLLHFGKPPGELFGSFFMNFLFGLIALRTKSVLWPLIIHMFMGVLMDISATLVLVYFLS